MFEVSETEGGCVILDARCVLTRKSASAAFNNVDDPSNSPNRRSLSDSRMRINFADFYDGASNSATTSQPCLLPTSVCLIPDSERRLVRYYQSFRRQK